MNDLIIIEEWLRNPERKFSEGLKIREKYKINNRLDDFFNRADAENPDGVAKNMLIQEISKIHIKIKSNPGLLEEKAALQISKQPITTSKTPTRTKVTIESDKVKAEDLPDELKPIFARIQEIVPVLSAKHAKLKVEDNDDNAKVLSEEIVALDDEKRELWGKIDEYFKTKNISLVVKQEEADAPILTPLEKVMAITDDNERLKAIIKREKIVSDDIARAIDKLEEFKKSKPHLVKQKEKSIAEKRDELKKLQDARSAIEGV